MNKNAASTAQNASDYSTNAEEAAGEDTKTTSTADSKSTAGEDTKSEGKAEATAPVTKGKPLSWKLGLFLWIVLVASAVFISTGTAKRGLSASYLRTMNWLIAFVTAWLFACLLFEPLHIIMKAYTFAKQRQAFDAYEETQPRFLDHNNQLVHIRFLETLNKRRKMLGTLLEATMYPFPMSQRRVVIGDHIYDYLKYTFLTTTTPDDSKNDTYASKMDLTTPDNEHYMAGRALVRQIRRASATGDTLETRNFEYSWSSPLGPGQQPRKDRKQYYDSIRPWTFTDYGESPVIGKLDVYNHGSYAFSLDRRTP
ncbi:hypothetical protein BaRGS_00016637, partial [Batillaria attramentaria]